MANKILVVGPAWIGDMVMAQSLLKILKQQPDTRIDVIAPTPIQPLLKRMPEIDLALQLPVGHNRLGLGHRWRIGRCLRRSYQQAIILPSSLKSALIPWFAHIPQRTGYLGEQRYGLLNDIRQLNKKAQPLCVQRFVSLGLPAGQTAGDNIDKPHLEVDHANQQAALARLKLNHLRPILALCPGADYGPAKRWPVAYFKTVAREQIEQGWQIWIFGSDKDYTLGQTIHEQLGEWASNLAGQTTLSEAIDLLALADKVISNDSGLMHITAALDRNLIALYGPSSPNFTPPLSPNAQLLSLELGCRPCFKRTCPLGHLECMTKLKPAHILAALSHTEAKSLKN